MSLKKAVDVKGTALRGGCNTYRDIALLKPGEFSAAQNVIPLHPGFQKRNGQKALHTHASAPDSTNQMITLFQNIQDCYPNTVRRYVQASDGDILSLDYAPPEINAGASVYTERWSGTTSPDPASWSKLNDYIILSNGVDMHQLGSGDVTAYPEKVYVAVKTTDNIAADITTAITTDAAGSQLQSYNLGYNRYIYIKTMFPICAINADVVSEPNTTYADRVMKIYHWTGTGAWVELTVTDGTEGTSGGHTATLTQDGSYTWSAATALTAVKKLQFGEMGYWYRLTIDPNSQYGWTTQHVHTKITVTYAAEFCSLTPCWDGTLVEPALVRVYDYSTGLYTNYASDSVDLSLLPVSSRVFIYAGLDPIEAIYVDVGASPNATAATLTVTGYASGAESAMSSMVDGTILLASTSLSGSGWITFERKASQTPITFEDMHGYWYFLTWDGILSDDMVVGFYVQPYFSIADWGTDGIASSSWKNRAVYTFDDYPEYLYISAPDKPDVLSGDETSVIEMGDGRPHKVVAIKRYFNNLMVFQEEKGNEGGCITLVQGYAPENFGKLVLSTTLGTMNAKSVDVVENVYTTTTTDEKLNTVVYFLSREGVFACEGTNIWCISAPIANYFDPNSSACIRKGYEKQMWLKHDPVYNVLRIGLVSGSTATTPNIFPVYDILDRVWYFDVRAQELSCWENFSLGAAAEYVGAITLHGPIVQVAGGVDDGTVYWVNTGYADVSNLNVSTAIDSYITLEFAGLGVFMDFLQMLLSCKVQSTGETDLTVTIYGNSILKHTLTLPMTVAYSTQTIRRHLLSLNVVDQHISVKIQHNASTGTYTLYGLGLEVAIWDNR